MYGMKLRLVRELRGLSQENVANRLGIAQNTYSKYENNQIKISAEMMEKLAEVLEVSPMDIMGQVPAVINFEQNQGTLFGNIETLVVGQKELYEQIIKSKDEEIARLVKLLDSMMKK
ncbi:XRE family transcriptional regulator [Pedobacter frigiditerrae]|uniref:XRE family transcriptional regulator n=1 Tax=Pedobacter frigiditerrae TaxID=2530452 RepID=A0A4R0N1Z0_9SPHI|nr:helix-turn-helix transcriptional regulator [Pedobacter frigiditerrae]TCC93705.1 XRE family transcriptional regulator [Pedobacter frigiditerrae]